MLHRPLSRAWAAGAALLTLSAGPEAARADTFYETGYVTTGSIVALPTSYVVPTAFSSSYIPTSSLYSVGEVVTTSATYAPSYRTTYRYRPRRYVERTSFLAPATYAVEPTSYLVPTSYLLPTSYVVPTTYAATSYLAPTSYLVDGGLVATSASSACCETATPAPVRATVSRPASPSLNSAGGGNTITSAPSNPVGSGERRPSGTVDDGVPSAVTPPVPAPAPRNPAANAGMGALPQPGPIDPDRPAAPAPPQAPAGTGTGPNDFPMPAPGQAGSQPQADETALRKSLRPAYETRNILRGRVVSFDSGRPEEGVSVIVSSRTNNFSDRPAMTDADGEFKVSLPDGDWTVKVRMPSGTVYPVGRDFLTASSGRILDGSGRNVREFLITR